MGRKSKGMLFKRNGVYYYKIQEDGRTFCRSCKTRIREEAEKAAREFSVGQGLPRKARLAAVQEFLRPDFANTDFEGAFKAFAALPKNIGMRADTLSYLRGHWHVFTRWLQGGSAGYLPACRAAHPEAKRIGQVSQRIAEEFVAWAKGHASPNTVNKYIATCRRVWNAVNAPSNPWESFSKLSQPPRQRRALTTAEIAHLIDAAEGETKVMFAIGAFTGLRMSDCATVKWEDFSADLSVLRVKPHKTKDSSGVMVSLPVHARLREVVEGIKGNRQGWLTPEFATAPRWRLSDAVMSVFSKCGLAEKAKAAGYRHATPVVGFHSLRASFVTMMCEAGAPLALVQSLVGHVSAEITQMYYRADAERARKFIDRLDFGSGGGK